jgi:hypothetical protein
MLRELRDLTAVAIIIYASAMRPKLPQSIIKLFDSGFFRMVIITLVAYMSNNNATLSFSILLAIGFVLIIAMIKEQLLYEGFIEGMEDMKEEENEEAKDAKVNGKEAKVNGKDAKFKETEAVKDKVTVSDEELEKLNELASRP